MKIINQLSKLICMFIVIIVFYMTPAMSQSQEQTNPSYSELLMSTILSIRWGSEAGFKLIGYPVAGLHIPSFYPREGLDEPNAVPFLIDTLTNGPDWTDQTVLTAEGGLFPYIARCYAALCLGSIKDKRAFEPLLETMQNGDFIRDQYNIAPSELESHNISDYAAISLGYLGDENAVEPLIKALQEKNIEKAVDALTMLRDIRAMEPVIEYATDHKIFNPQLHVCLEYISRVSLYSTYSSTNRTYSSPDFPELGELPYSEFYEALWQYWLINGDRFAKQQFEENYIKWVSIKQERPDELSAQNYSLRKMIRGGIPALPYIISGIKNGDESLVSAVNELFYPQPDSERLSDKYPPIDPNVTECLQWWEQNKQFWLIFPSLPEILKVPSAYPNIQAAIDDANDGDTVLVADGTFTGDGNRDIDFKGKAITVKSQNGPEKCIIDCQGTFREPHRGFYFHNNEDANSIIQSITVTGGYFMQWATLNKGGAILCENSSPQIIDCIIIGNQTDEGGAVATVNSSARIINCLIGENFASSGGGIICEGGNPVLERCCIQKNQAAFAGGIYCLRTDQDILILNCSIKENIAKSSGGGLICSKGTIISGCLIVGNIALEDSQYSFSTWGAPALRGGGGVASNGEGSVLINCTISENKANTGSGILSGCGSDTVKWTYLYNCIVWGNSGGDENQIVISPCCQGCVNPIMPNGISAYYCCFQGTPSFPEEWPHNYYSYINFNNCINVDPCFAATGCWIDVNDSNNITDPNALKIDSDFDLIYQSRGSEPNYSPVFIPFYWIEGDYHLKSQAGRWNPKSQTWVQDDVTSACIDAGDPNSPIGLEPFPNGGYINMGAYGGTSEASKSYFGKPVCETIVAGDINGDCKVDEADLEILMLHWLEEH